MTALLATEHVYGWQASILKTLANPRRLEIVHLLGESGPMEVHRLAEHFGMTQPAVSQHLALMKQAGLVEAVRCGRDVRYRLIDPELVAACSLMRQFLIRRMTRLGHLAASFVEPVEPPALEANLSVHAGN